MKQSYNFLGGSCLFFYRDIFSGLSNETTGTASYALFYSTSLSPATPCRQGFPASFTYIYFSQMNQTTLSLVDVIVKYNPLLQRYAMLRVHNALVADSIVKQAFEAVYDKNKFKCAEIVLRQQLTAATGTACQHWLKSISETPNN